MAKNNTLRDIFIIILVAAAFSLPFIDQAFHIDDTNFLYITKQILNDPLRPYSFDINWRGTDERAFDILANPPLCPYYYALVIKTFGESECVLHGACLVFIVMCVVFMYFLARRFTQNPLISTLLLISTPAFMVMSHTIMPDIALLAFYLAGITLFIYGIDNKNTRFLILSGLCMGLASLARYSGLTIFFVAAMYLVFVSREITKKALIPFVTGGLIFCVWCLHNIIFYKKMHFLAASSFQLVTLTPEDVFCKIEALLVYAGSATLFFIFFIYGFFKKEYKSAFLILAAACLYFAGVASMRYGVSLLQIFLIAVFMLSCAYFFFVAVDRIIKEPAGPVRREYVFLLAWVFFIILFTSTVYFAAVKHILLFLPALIILFVVMAGNFLGRKAKFYISLAFIMTALSGLFISYADFKYADVYRDFAVKSAKKYKTSQNSVWFAGHWGFQYYMEKNGFKTLSYPGNFLLKGDVLIVPELTMEHEMFPQTLQNRLLLSGSCEYNSFLPVRVVNKRLNINFYSNKMLGCNPGFLPYCFSCDRLERFMVYEVI